jgi:hypothetical protein
VIFGQEVTLKMRLIHLNLASVIGMSGLFSKFDALSTKLDAILTPVYRNRSSFILTH